MNGKACGFSNCVRYKVLADGMVLGAAVALVQCVTTLDPGWE
jgi:hypothetical protein